jgi:hypothetical protein
MNIKNTGRNPPPNNYEIKSMFKKNKEKAKGKTFGLSRLVLIKINFKFIIHSQCQQREIELLLKDFLVLVNMNISRN